MIPGEVHCPDQGQLELSQGRGRVRLAVINSGDRPVQVGSHYHFAEANPALVFDRSAARGRHLDVPAGTSVRFEPGLDKEVTLVDFAGRRVAAGFRGEVGGPLGPPAPSGSSSGVGGAAITRPRYAALYGPTVGDRVRLADSDLWVEVDQDLCGGPGAAGDEVVFGGGKVIRESMGQGSTTRAQGAPDVVITGALIEDHWGVVKADVGVRDGRIAAIGKAGNPDIMDAVKPGLEIGPSTEVIAGNNRILTCRGN